MIHRSHFSDLSEVQTPGCSSQARQCAKGWK